eukprot:TRINITY_DN1669_c0_g2_i4.p1 TRINITY_DN1669_c0_g2~~TRINITY_DN1669_c0_g2_i4.p1  ORF type:complete len:1005 (+),score=183.47 TRINITY_DN1669_c0_g2_i4:1321-4335(+)
MSTAQPKSSRKPFKRQITRDIGSVKALCVVEDATDRKPKSIWVACRDNQIHILDPETGAHSRTIRTSAVCMVLVRRKIWAGCIDGAIRIYDSSNGTLVNELQAHSGCVNSLAVVEAGVWSGGTDFGLKLWDAQTFETLRVLQIHRHWVRCILPTSDNVIWSGAEHSVLVWDEAGTVIKEIPDKATVLALCEVDDKIWLGSSDHTIRIYDKSSYHLLRELSGHQGAVTSFQRFGAYIWSASGDGTVRVWEAATGQPTAVLKSHTGWVSALSVVGNDVWSAGADKRIHVWDTNVTKLVQRSAKLTGITMSPHSPKTNSSMLDASIVSTPGPAIPVTPSTLSRTQSSTAKSVVGLEKTVAELQWKLEAEQRARAEVERMRTLLEGELSAAEKRFLEKENEKNLHERAAKRLNQELTHLREDARRRFGSSTQGDTPTRVSALDQSVRVDALETTLKDKDAELESLRSELQQYLAARTTEVDELNEKTRTTTATYEEQLSQLENAYHVLETHCSELRQRLSLAESKQRDAEAALQQSSVQLGSLHQMNSQLRTAQDDLPTLQVELQRATDEASQLRRQNSDLALQVQSVSDSLDKSARQNESLSRDLYAATTKLEKTLEERRAMDAARGQLQLEFEVFRERMTELQSDRERDFARRIEGAARSDEATRLAQDQLTAAEKQRGIAERLALDLQDKVKTTSRENESLREKIAHLEQQLQAVSDENSRLRSISEASQANVADLTRKLEVANAGQRSVAELTRKLEAANAQLSANDVAAEELQLLRESTATANRKVVQLQRQLENQQPSNELPQLRAELQKVIQERDSSLADARDTKAKLRALHSHTVTLESERSSIVRDAEQMALAAEDARVQVSTLQRERDEYRSQLQLEVQSRSQVKKIVEYVKTIHVPSDDRSAILPSYSSNSLSPVTAVLNSSHFNASLSQAQALESSMHTPGRMLSDTDFSGSQLSILRQRVERDLDELREKMHKSPHLSSSTISHLQDIRDVRTQR